MLHQLCEDVPALSAESTSTEVRPSAGFGWNKALQAFHLRPVDNSAGHLKVSRPYNMSGCFNSLNASQ